MLMDMREWKCVLVADEQLPAGVLANTAAILGISLGRMFPDCVGPDVSDASGQIHRGITQLPVLVLKSDALGLRRLRTRLEEPGFAGVYMVDFSDVARGCGQYADYMELAGQTPETDHTYLGLALFGARKQVSRLTGSLPLLR